jgi:site-specific DNA recombinase
LAEIVDAGQSGATLERPGLNEIREKVAAEDPRVDLVWVQDADRITDPIHRAFLDEEMERFGTRLMALDDWGDDSHEGELLRYMKGWVSKGERLKTAERSRRGKLRKAREGKILAGRLPDYSFAFNETRDNYVVNEETMAVVRRIFYMVGMEGKSISAVKKILTSEGLPSPGGRRWEREFIRSTIKDEVYRPHSHEEVSELVTSEVAARLDSDKCYGIWWFNQRRVVQTQVSEHGENGRRYRKRTTTSYKPRKEWIAVPVPDSGIPREWVDTAREAIEDNRVASSAGRRFWELSGGICYCGGCGNRMMSYTTRAGRARKLYHYYRCRTRQQHGKDACAQKTSYHALNVEEPVWEFVSGYLKDPEQLRSDLERMIELEREGLRGDPDQEAKVWLRKLAEVDQKRSGCQDMAAEGLIAFDELRTKLAALEETRQTAQRELTALEGRRERIEQMERDRDTLLKQYEAVTSDALDTLTPEERQEFYKILKLRVTVDVDGTLEVTGAFFEGAGFCLSHSTQVSLPHTFQVWSASLTWSRNHLSCSSPSMVRSSASISGQPSVRYLLASSAPQGGPSR